MVPADPPGIWYLHASKGTYTLLARSIEGILDVVDRDDSGPATQPDDDEVLRQTYRYLPIPYLPPGWHILQSWSTKKLDVVSGSGESGGSLIMSQTKPRVQECNTQGLGSAVVASEYDGIKDYLLVEPRTQRSVPEPPL
ncbi:hypothetical protein B0H13DRAFT_1856483 [Mycena leptocephala]|nr:hypothetical protein B0H13DRAFT_1856483 [Mycena leptocephala]